MKHKMKITKVTFDFLFKEIIKKAPRQGIEPWFSDLESDVLTIERPRISYSYLKIKYFITPFKI